MRWERRGSASIAALGGSQVQVPGLTEGVFTFGGFSAAVSL